jgi:hypothetical protein
MIKVDYSKLTKKIANLKKVKEKAMAEALVFFKKSTPIRSGNARKNTYLNAKKDIVADYAYAEKLDTGWSKQARQGMTKPTLTELKKIVKKQVKNLGV